MERFLEKVQKDPGLVDRTLKQDELRLFKEKYHVVGASGLKCPACAAYLDNPGSLWWDPQVPTYFICRKCKLIFHIECLNVKNSMLLEELKRISKGGKDKYGGLPFWLTNQEELKKYDPNKYDYLEEEGKDDS